MSCTMVNETNPTGNSISGKDHEPWSAKMFNQATLKGRMKSFNHSFIQVVFLLWRLLHFNLLSAPAVTNVQICLEEAGLLHNDCSFLFNAKMCFLLFVLRDHWNASVLGHPAEGPGGSAVGTAPQHPLFFKSVLAKIAIRSLPRPMRHFFLQIQFSKFQNSNLVKTVSCWWAGGPVKEAMGMFKINPGPQQTQITKQMEWQTWSKPPNRT